MRSFYLLCCFYLLFHILMILHEKAKNFVNSIILDVSRILENDNID